MSDRTIRPGGLIGRENGIYGTVGAILRDGSERFMVLTAGHVADLRPASYDPLPRGLKNLTKNYDFGIVSIPAGLPIASTACYPDALPITQIAPAVVGHAVYKDGAATGRTWGTITERRDNGLIVVRPLPFPPLGVQDYEISAAGDSGAIWRDVYTHAAVALHTAGDNREGPGYEAAYAVPMTEINKILPLRFYTETKKGEDMGNYAQDENAGQVTIQVVTVKGKPADVMPILRDLLAAQFGGGGP